MTGTGNKKKVEDDKVRESSSSFRPLSLLFLFFEGGDFRTYVPQLSLESVCRIS